MISTHIYVLFLCFMAVTSHTICLQHALAVVLPSSVNSVANVVSSHSKIASEYDQRNADAIVQLERYINERIPFIGIKQGEGVRLLDYACGTGMLSRVGAFPSCWHDLQDT